MQLYKKISESNLKKYGTDSEKVLRIIINQYSDRTHFIYEILQNAEDAGATNIRFHLTKDELQVIHDGRPFDEKDIDGVCGIASGTKEDGTRIGHFGIGFKSVYCYTELPRIYSGQYHFVIKNQLFPEEIPEMTGLSYDDTCMVLPFNKESVEPAVAYKEISDALKNKITAESIIMLDSIEKITIDIDGVSDRKVISKLKNKVGSLENGTHGAVYALGMSTENIRSNKIIEETDTDYLFFTDNAKETSALVFKVGGDSGKQLYPIKNTKIYAFFPTAKEAHQNFYIHAPFDTTPARDNFKEGAEYGKHNLKLISNICELITDSLIWMRDNGYLSFSGFNTVFPIYEYDKQDVLYGIYENSIGTIASGLELLPTNTPGMYKSIDSICVPQSANIVDTFDNDDLKKLINRQLNWIAKEISTESYSDLRHFLNSNFKLKIVGWKELVKNMNENFLRVKSISWMEKLALRIQSFCLADPSINHDYINMKEIPFVRTSEGRQICARAEDGHFQVYMNNPKKAEYKIANEILANERLTNFYRYVLQIPEYDVAQETRETILPKYSEKKVKFRTKDHIRENIEDLKTIKDAIYTNAFIIDQIQDKYIVTDGKDWYRPAELYIKSEDTRAGFQLVKGLVDFKFLADEYFEDSVMSIRLDDEFFRRIGCNPSIKELSAPKDKFLEATSHYRGTAIERDLRNKVFGKSYISERLGWAFYYEGFPEVFREMSFDKSLKIARFLNPNVMKFDIQGEIVGADDQHFSGSHVDSTVAFSMIGLQLSFEKWIYIKDSEEPQRPVDVDRNDLRPEYRQVKRVMDLLPFKEVKNAISDFIDANIENAGDREIVKKYMSKTEDMVKFAKAMAKTEAKEAAKAGKAKTIEDLIKNGDVNQQEGKTPSGGLEVNPISEKGKEKREESLDKILAESLDHEIRVARGLQFASRESNKEERQFLLSEYSGTCQICEKQITKFNGEEYFEAINIIKFSDMQRQYSLSGKLGWNSLCLCPNCAAEYNYCSKKISSLYDQVMTTEVIPDSDIPITIEIEMPQGTPRRIHYSPRHFIALKEALKVFTQNDSGKK